MTIRCTRSLWLRIFGLPAGAGCYTPGKTYLRMTREKLRKQSYVQKHAHRTRNLELTNHFGLNLLVQFLSLQLAEGCFDVVATSMLPYAGSASSCRGLANVDDVGGKKKVSNVFFTLSPLMCRII